MSDDKLVTAAELGKVLGITAKSVIRHAAAGIVVRGPGRGQYKFDASISRYVQH